MKTGPKPREGVLRNIHGQIICEHKKLKHQCIDCVGASICEHKRRRYNCRICRPESFCIHDKRKERCILCDGSGLCVHGIGKHYCKKCGGKGICEHSRERRRCSICDPFGAYKKAQDGAVSKGLDFLLSAEEFILIVSQPCYFCGEADAPRGVDRFNNGVGYEKANCVSACWPCNSAKKEKHGSEFIRICMRVAAQHQKG